MPNMTAALVPMSDDEIHAEHEIEKALQLHFENSRNAWVAACKDIGLTPTQADDVFHQALDHESRLAIPDELPAIPHEVCRAIRVALQCERENGYEDGHVDGYDKGW